MAPEVLISKRGGELQEREGKSRVDWSTPYDEWLVPTLNRFRYGGAIECRAIPSEIQLNIEALIRAEKLKLLAEVRERVMDVKNDLYFKNKIPQTLPEYMDDVVKVREQLRVEQGRALTKLEAEL